MHWTQLIPCAQKKISQIADWKNDNVANFVVFSWNSGFSLVGCVQELYMIVVVGTSFTVLPWNGKRLRCL